MLVCMHVWAVLVDIFKKIYGNEEMMYLYVTEGVTSRHKVRSHYIHEYRYAHIPPYIHTYIHIYIRAHTQYPSRSENWWRHLQTRLPISTTCAMISNCCVSLKVTRPGSGIVLFLLTRSLLLQVCIQVRDCVSLYVMELVEERRSTSYLLVSTL